MDVSNAGKRSFFVAILAFIVGTAGMATSVLSVWYNALFPPPPHKPLTIDDLRLLREHHGVLTPSASGSAKSTSASGSSNPDGDVDTPLPEPFQKPGFAKAKLRPMITNAARRVSFTEPPSPTVMANALADRLRAVKPRHRSPSPPKPTQDDSTPGPSCAESSAHPSPPAHPSPSARSPSILRMTRVFSNGRSKRASLGSMEASVSEFGERKPPLARALTFNGHKEPALVTQTVTEDVAAEEAAEHPPASTQTQPERGRFGWRLRRSKTGDTLARPGLQRKGTSPAAGPPQFLPPTPSISPLALPVDISPTSSASGAQVPSTPTPERPRRMSSILLPPAGKDAPSRRASAPTRRLSSIVAPATRAAGLRSPSLPTPPRRLSSILCHHTSPSPSTPAPTSPRTQPYGAPYFTPPPDAGTWAVPADNPRAKRASLPADLRAR